MPLESEKDKTDMQRGDDVINVTLSVADYETLRDMIVRQQSLNWIGKWIRNVLLVAIGGILTLVAFGDQIKQLFGFLSGGH